MAKKKTGVAAALVLLALLLAAAGLCGGIFGGLLPEAEAALAARLAELESLAETGRRLDAGLRDTDSRAQALQAHNSRVALELAEAESRLAALEEEYGPIPEPPA